jgi:hypothetical protein
MGGISILTSKELSSTYQPLLLCEFELPNGTFFRVSTHPLSSGYGGTPTAGSYEYGGHPWVPRVLNEDLGATQSMADFGFDIPPTVTVVMADPDGEVYGLEMANGFKGAVLKLYSVMWDVGNASTGSFNSDSPTFVKFIGTCGPATAIDQKTISVTAVSLLNMSQQQMPPVRIQPLCPWSFPPTSAARADALANNDSQYYECGYSPDLAGGVGNYSSGTACFTYCAQSPTACVERLGNSAAAIPILKDASGRATGRFGGFDFVPVQNVGLQRAYVSGQWTLVIDAVNQARYGDYVPLAYGTTWIEPEIMGVYGDSNYTRFEALACFNQAYEVMSVVVNGDVIPCYPGSTVNGTYIYDGNGISSNGVIAPGVTRSTKDNFWIAINSGARGGGSNPWIGWSNKGDCYGSMFGMLVQVLVQLASQSTLPQCQILLQAGLVRVYSSVSTYALQYSSNPAWVLLDLLIKTSWRYSQVNIQSFINAAAVCDTPIFFNRLAGDYSNEWNESAYPPYQRYSVGFSVKQRMPIGDLIRGVRNAMRGMLYFDFNTGLLTVGNKQTLADQQPSPVAGSNYNTPVPSIKCMTTQLVPAVDGSTTTVYILPPYYIGGSLDPGTVILVDGEEMSVSSHIVGELTVVRGVNGTSAVPHAQHATVFFVANGYVAYSFDGSSIMKDDKGASTLRVTQKQPQETPNKVTSYFFDRENQYGQDISTLIDVEDVNRTGAEVTGAFPLIGPQTFDHINRVTATWFAENYRGNPRLDYQGSEIGDTGGTLQFEFETSVKAIHLMVGQICLISDAQRGIVNQLFRISRIQPSQNFETAKIAGYWHNDAWYADDFGQGANQGVYVNPRSAGQGSPMSWKPGYEAPQAGDAYYSASDLNFGVAQVYEAAADGTSIAQIQITGVVPVNSFPDVPLSPQLEVVGTGDVGGGYSPSTSYFVALSAMAPGGLGMSPLSNICPVSLSPSQNALDVVAQGWPDSGSGYFAFVGLSPSSMTCQTSSAVEASLIQLKNTYKEASWGQPDQMFSRFQISLRKEIHAGVFGAQVVSVTSNSIKVGVYQNNGFTTNQWAGREVCVYGIQPSDYGVPTRVPIANFVVASNTEDTLTLSSGNPTTCVYGGTLNPDDVIVMRMKPTFGHDSGGYYFEDLQLENSLSEWSPSVLLPITNVTYISSNSFSVDHIDDPNGALATGEMALVQGVAGWSSVNGIFFVVGDSAGHCELVGGSGSISPGTYSGGGLFSAGPSGSGLAVDAEVGNTAFIIAGTGVGTSAKIASNTSTRCYIVGEWPVTPDSTTRISILDSTINFLPVSDAISNSTPQLLQSYLANISNYNGQSIFVQVRTVSAGGNVSQSTLDPFREMYLFGQKGSITGASGITLQVDGTLAIGSNQAPLVSLNSSSTPVAVVASVKTAPIGANLTININLGGALWLSLTMLDGLSTVSVTSSQVSWGSLAAGANITLDIAAVGTTVPGSDLSVMIYL